MTDRTIPPEDLADRGLIAENDLLRQMAEHEGWAIWKKYLYGQLSVHFEHFLVAPESELVECRGAAKALYNILEIVDSSEERILALQHQIMMRHEEANREAAATGNAGRAEDVRRIQSMGIGTL